MDIVFCQQHYFSTTVKFKVIGALYRKQYGLQDRLVLTAMFKSMRRQWKFTNQIRYQRYDEQKDKRMEEVTAILTNATYEDEDKASIFKRYIVYIVVWLKFGLATFESLV